MSGSITVLPLQTTTVDKSGDYAPVAVSIGSSVIVEKDANTPVGDPVNVTFSGLSIGAASSITVQNGATLTVLNAVGLDVSGSMNIGAGSTLIIPASFTASVDVPTHFVGPNATLVTSQTGVAFASTITGFDASDTIDFRNVTAATAVQYAGGVLSVLNGSTVVASATVGGSFSAATLALAADGSGGFSVGDNIGVASTRLSGASAQYKIAVSGNYDYVQDNVSGRDGAFLTGSGQTLGFSDGVSIADPTGIGENVAHLYQAVLGRAADLPGFEAWMAAINTGVVNNTNLGDAFVGAANAEFNAHYGTASTNTQFVSILEQNTGGSSTDPSAQAAITQLNAGASRGSIAFMVAESPNGVTATAGYSGDANTAEVYRLFEATLGRATDPSGNATFTSELQGGATPTQVEQQILGSAEYAAKYGGQSDTAFVAQHYQNALNRAPDPGGLQGWLNALGAGTARATVAIGIADSLEAKLATASATHDGSVFLKA